MIRINFNGPTVSDFMSHAQAVANGMTHTAKYAVNRYIDEWYYRRKFGLDSFKLPDDHIGYQLYSTAIWSDKAFSIRYPIANGTYYVSFEVGENSQDYSKEFEIAVEGQSVIPVPGMRRGECMTDGREVTVRDGQLFVAVRPIDGSKPGVHLMAMSIYN